MARLDPEEKDLLDLLNAENGNQSKDDGKSSSAIVTTLARLQERQECEYQNFTQDLEALQKRALEEGIHYQTNGKHPAQVCGGRW